MRENVEKKEKKVNKRLCMIGKDGVGFGKNKEIKYFIDLELSSENITRENSSLILNRRTNGVVKI